MRFSDSLSGAVTAIFGAVIVAVARTFPGMPGQPVGPSLVPTIIGVGLIACGLILAASGLRHRRPWIELDAWLRRPRMVLNFVLVFADLVFYAMVVDRLGFFLTAVVFLSTLMVAFGVPRSRIVPLALIVTLAMHYAFYSLLRVPLPWGLLEGIAW